MPETEYHTIRVDNRSRIPLLIKEIFTSNKKSIQLLINEPLEWMRNDTQLRFLKHKIEEQGKTLTIASNNQEVIALARAASIDVRPYDASQQSNAPSVALNAEDQKKVVKKQRQQTTGAHITISKKDKNDPSKERVVVKSEYALSNKDATGKISFFPRKGRVHTFSVKKQFSQGLLSRILKKNKQPSQNAQTKTQSGRGEGGGKAKAILSATMRRKKLTFISVVVLAILITAIFFATNVLPSATIRITPQTREASISYNFIANANISENNTEQHSIPAQILESQIKKNYTVLASGSENIEEYAEGEITIYNEFGSEPQVLRQGTRFANADGIIFRTPERVTVPGAKIDGGSTVPGSITVKVRAYEAGDLYNIGPTTFSIPGFRSTEKYRKFYGRSEQAMTGGAKGVRRVITQEDIDAVRTTVEREMFSKVESDLRNEIKKMQDNQKDDIVAIEDTLRSDIKDPDLAAKVGQALEEGEEDLKVPITVRARIVTISQTYADDLLNQYITTQEQYNSAEEEQGGTRNIDYKVRENDYTRGIARLTMDVAQSFRKTIDKEALFAEIAGKNSVEVRRILGTKVGETIQAGGSVRFWPFWVNKVPSKRDDVKIDIEYID